MKLGNLFTQNNRLRLFGLVTLASAAVISFTSLRDLSASAGFGNRSWLLPLCVDAVAALGMEVWLSAGPAWKAGRNLALVSILGSLAGNAGDWWIKSASYLSAGLGIVPPAALAAVLLVLHKHWNRSLIRNRKAAEATPAAQPERPVQAPQTAARPASATSPKTVTKPQHSVRQDRPAQAPKTKAGDQEKVAQLIDYATERGELPTRREAQAYLRDRNGVGVGTDKATALLALAREALDSTLPAPVQLHPIPARDESDSDSARQEARL